MEFSISRIPIQNCSMSEINIADPSRHRAGVNRIKKANLKIDMTPMVDLGFLLMSFFIFTTEISKPAITHLYMPKKGDSTKIAESRSLTILLDGDYVFYYNGDVTMAMKNNQVFPTSFNEISGIGHVIRLKQNELEKRKVNKKDLVVLIKPGTNSSYKNVVNSLDEMLINGVTRYAILDLEEKEKRYLESAKDIH